MRRKPASLSFLVCWIFERGVAPLRGWGVEGGGGYFRWLVIIHVSTRIEKWLLHVLTFPIAHEGQFDSLTHNREARGGGVSVSLSIWIYFVFCFFIDDMSFGEMSFCHKLCVLLLNIHVQCLRVFIFCREPRQSHMFFLRKEAKMLNNELSR